jgi:hypothetical protein
VLVALSGCDYTFQLDHIEQQPAACGPYRDVREVAIVGVDEPHHFSISADGQLAFVMGRDTSGRKRPIALAWNGTAWEPHASFQAGLDTTGIEGFRLAPAEEIPQSDQYTGPVQPAANAWIVNQNRHQVTRYYWTGSTWTQDSLQLPILDPEYDTRAGNVVLVRGSTPAERVRHTVLSKIAVELGTTNQIVIASNAPPMFNLIPKTDRTRPLNEDAIDHDVSLGDAVLTDDLAKLVYVAVSGGQADLYASAQSPVRDFASGGVLAELATADDEVEPWIDATCSKLYFRRVPAGSPNAPGTIFVAE